MNRYYIYFKRGERGINYKFGIEVIERAPVSDIVLDFNEELAPNYSIWKIEKVDGDDVKLVYPR